MVAEHGEFQRPCVSPHTLELSREARGPEPAGKQRPQCKEGHGPCERSCTEAPPALGVIPEARPTGPATASADQSIVVVQVACLEHAATVQKCKIDAERFP